MRLTYDGEANAAYVEIDDDVADAAAVENVVVERPGRGDIVLDFDADGRLLGVEIVGATELLRTTVLATAVGASVHRALLLIGTAGVGKSTVADALGQILTAQGRHGRHRYRHAGPVRAAS